MESDNASQFTDDPNAGGSNGIDWQACFQALRKRLWLVILCVVLGGIASAAYMNGQRQEYQARSVLFIEQGQSRVLEKVQGVQEDQIVSVDMINTVVDLLRSYPFAQRVAGRLNLQKDPRFLASLAEKPIGPLTVDAAAGALVSSVTANYRPRTRLIDIFVSQPDSSLAVDLANTYAEEYVRYGFDRRADTNKAANQFLLDESERLRRQVRTSEEAMQSFRERERAASLETMQQASEVKLAEISRGMGEVDNRLAQLDNDLRIAAGAKPGDFDALLRLPSVASQPKVLELNQAISDAERQFTLLKQRYRSRHPSYIAAQTQIDSLLRDRNALLQDVVGLLKGERQRLQAQHDELKRENEDQQTHLLSVTGKSVEYNDLKRTLETNTAMYNAITARVAEVDVTKGMTDSPVRVHERAAGAMATRVNPVKVYALGIIGGLLAGIGFVLAIHLLDQSIKTVDQAEELAGIPVLAAIPRKSVVGGRQLDVVSDRDGVVAEGFRSLRTSLAMTAHAEDRRCFLFTSAQPAEGKTFCSTNFAATLSQQGFKTLLIDADLRRPTVSRLFFGENRKPGLSDVLAGQTTFADAIISTQVPDLMILPAGSRAPNPAELLAGQRMRGLLKEALSLYDRVVVDSAPVLAVSDSLLIAPHVDVTCIVLRSFRTKRKIFLRALKVLDEIDCHAAGLVFNFIPTGSGSDYYYSGKYYGQYGEKGVYGT